jgi:hypothetical protein
MNLATNVSLYPIYRLADATDDEPFDFSVLPLKVAPDVTIETVSPMFGPETWTWVQHDLSRRDIDYLKSVRHAIVHRYQVSDVAFLGDGGTADRDSAQLLYNLAALMRLIRPMRQFAMYMGGSLQADGTLKIRHFEHPIELMEVPEVGKYIFTSTSPLFVLLCKKKRGRATVHYRTLAGDRVPQIRVLRVDAKQCLPLAIAGQRPTRRLLARAVRPEKTHAIG